jgi:hypothetical protein
MNLGPNLIDQTNWTDGDSGFDTGLNGYLISISSGGGDANPICEQTVNGLTAATQYMLIYKHDFDDASVTFRFLANNLDLDMHSGVTIHADPNQSLDIVSPVSTGMIITGRYYGGTGTGHVFDIELREILT